MLKLAAEKRTKEMKADRIRKEGKVPAVFYGRKEEATPISISRSDFNRVLREAGESTVISLECPDKKLQVLIHDVDFDPVKGTPIHVDFYAIEADKAVEVSVPLEFTGTAPAAKELGGVLVKVLHEIEIEALPKDLPSAITVDLAPLTALDSRILIKDLKLPEGVGVMHDPEEVVVAMTEQAPEEEEVPSEEFDASQVEIEEKGKAEEDAEVEEDGSESKKKKE